MLMNSVDEMKLRENVIFTDFQANVANYVNAMDIVIFASEPEPFGRVNIEAMALKKTLVASRVGGAIEIIEDGKTGYFFEHNNEKDLADKVIELLLNPGLTHEMGTAAYNRVNKYFHIKTNVEKTQKLYDGLIGH